MEKLRNKFETEKTVRAEELNDSQAKKKPNLRNISTRDGPRFAIICGCILVTVFMYPMIFRPLFGVGQSSMSDMESKLRKEIASTRPSFMPEWTSPFGPKNKNERRDE